MKLSPKVFLISIGNELIRGETLNSNASTLGKFLYAQGMVLVGERTVPDNSDEIFNSIDNALQKADWIITTGGLGPTFDDITRNVISEYLEEPLIFQENLFDQFLKRISKIRTVKKYEKDKYEQQFYIPRKSKPINNKIGSALGFMAKHNNKMILSLPGVPGEFEGMLKGSVKKLFDVNAKKEVRTSITAKAISISELDFLKKLGSLPKDNNFHFGIYPEEGSLRFVVSTKGSNKQSKDRIKKIRNKMDKGLHPYIYSYSSEETFEQVFCDTLKKQRKTLSVAESCTGGQMSKLLTDIPGASDYFKGGVIAYSNEIKEYLVDVSKKTLKKHGAVSKQVAYELAKNIRLKFKTDYGISVTGIAGPQGGTKAKPVGLIYVGIANKNSVYTYELLLRGSRERIRNITAKKALFLLWKKLRQGSF